MGKICKKCQILFSGKNNKSITNLLYTELAQRVTEVKSTSDRIDRIPVDQIMVRYRFKQNANLVAHILSHVVQVSLFVLRFYGPVNPMGSCRARSVYLITHLLGRLSPLSG